VSIVAMRACRRRISGYWSRCRRHLRRPFSGRLCGFSGQEALAVRASKKLRNDELLVTTFAGTSLRRELDRIPLWRIWHELSNPVLRSKT